MPGERPARRFLPCIRRAALGVCLLAVTVSGPGSRAQDYDESSALAVSQAAIGRQLSDFSLAGSDGTPITLDQFEGRPLVVSLIYTSCHHVCPMLTQHIGSVVDIAREALGEASFSVLAVGFDSATDTPDRMRSYARQRGLDGSGWHWASADEPTIQRITEELGFVYFATPKGYDHLTQTTIVDGKGRVHRHVYGADFSPPALVEPLKSLIRGTNEDTGTLAGWLENVRLFCTLYDPATGRYRFDYSLILSLIIGSLCLGAVGLFIVRAWRESNCPGPIA